MTKKTMWIIIISIAVCLGIIVTIYVSRPSKTPKSNPTKSIEKPSEPVFRQDGTLEFWSGKKLLKIISIEIAQTEATRNRGLMYRSSMSDTCGMLFIFENMQPLSFWMKNTHLPLDIIYIDDNFQIVSIAKNTIPFSEESIPSEAPGMYVVEVNAGFTDNYKIKKGDKINFTFKK